MSDEERRELIKLLLIDAIEVWWAGEDDYDLIREYLKRMLAFLEKKGIALTQEEMVEILGFLGGSATTYKLMAKILGYTGEWGPVIEAQFDTIVKGGGHSGDDYIEIRMTLAKELGATVEPFGESLCKAVAAAVIAEGPGSHDKIEGALEELGWTAEMIEEAPAKYLPNGTTSFTA